jgi:hypothetical protein
VVGDFARLSIEGEVLRVVELIAIIEEQPAGQREHARGSGAPRPGVQRVLVAIDAEHPPGARRPIARRPVAGHDGDAMPPTMNSRYLPSWMVCLSMVLAACEGRREEIRAEDYDQTCSKDEDCMTVLAGNACKCSCDMAAINDRDVGDYTRDLADIKAECVDELAKCAKCPEMKGAVCASGKCAVEAGPVVE